MKLCMKIADEDCIDKEEYCEWGPDCDVTMVKENCPKYCNLCDRFKSSRPDNQQGYYILSILQKIKSIDYFNDNINFNMMTTNELIYRDCCKGVDKKFTFDQRCFGSTRQQFGYVSK